MIQDILKKKKLNIRQLSQKSGLSYSTLYDLVNNTSDYKKCNVSNFIKIATALEMTVEELYKQWNSYSFDIDEFEIFKSNICQMLKNIGDFNFISFIIDNNIIEKHIKKNEIYNALYLVGIIDFLCNKYQIPLYKGYEKIRQIKIEEEIYPLSVITLTIIQPDRADIIKEKYKNTAIKELLDLGIVEGNIYGVA